MEGLIRSTSVYRAVHHLSSHVPPSVGPLSIGPTRQLRLRFGYIVFRVRVVEAAVAAAEAYPYVVEGGILGGGRQRELVGARNNLAGKGWSACFRTPFLLSRCDALHFFPGLGTDPLVADTDGDGLADGAELPQQCRPLLQIYRDCPKRYNSQLPPFQARALSLMTMRKTIF